MEITECGVFEMFEDGGYRDWEKCGVVCVGLRVYRRGWNQVWIWGVGVVWGV